MSSSSEAQLGTTAAGRAGGRLTGEASWLTRQLRPYLLVILLAVEVLVFWALVPDEFGTTANLKTTLLTQAVLGILTLGILIPLMVGEFDVSLAALFTTAMLVAASLVVDQGWPLWAAFAAAPIFSAAVGATTGVLVVVTRAHSLIVSLGVLTLLQGVSQALTEGTAITIAGSEGHALRAFSESTVLGIPAPVVCLAALALVVWFVTEMTPLGRRWFAIGGSIEGARLAGLRVDALRIVAFAVGGFLAGFAAILQLSESTAATESFGDGFLFPAIAAAFLGAVAFRIGDFNVRGAITAIFVLAVGVTGIRMLGAPSWIDGVFNGTALIVAVAIVRAVRGSED